MSIDATSVALSSQIPRGKVFYRVVEVRPMVNFADLLDFFFCQISPVVPVAELLGHRLLPVRDRVTDKPTKITISPELRDALLRIALETDVVAEFRGTESWRVAAVSAARWLLRCAAESEDMPRSMHSTLRQIANVAKRMSSHQISEQRTKSGELRMELEKFLDDDEEEET